MSLYTFAQAYDLTNTPPAVPQDASAALILLPFAFFVLLLAYVVYSWLLGRIFRKAGIEDWKAWVPGYNIWLIYTLGGQPGWWTVLLFVPVINIAAAILLYIVQYRIGRGFGKSGVFVLWAIFMPLVWFAWLAFDKSTWHDDTGIEAAAA